MSLSKNFNPAVEWKSHIPVPVDEEHPEYLELYWKAWELAHDHIKDVPGLPQTPYMDEAASPYDIWIWDTCFMSLFCKYAQNRFPGVESLNNFYSILYEGAVCPRLPHPDVPEGLLFGIHIADNPPLFAWTEYENLLMSGDLARVKYVLLEKQYLQKHFDYLENLKEYGTHPPMIRAITCWVKHERGYFWEGGRSGMDNTPRGRKFAPTTVNRPDNKHILWVDAIAQQGLSALYIAKLAIKTGAAAIAAEWMDKYNKLKDMLNTYYWDETDGFYYDICADSGEFVKVMTPASYWAMLAEMVPADRAERMVKYLTDPQKLGGMLPCVTLSRDDPDFHAENGLYWRGAMWLPTAYMTIKALEKYDMIKLASKLSATIVDHMYKTYRDYDPHTIWECYAPNSYAPSHSCARPNCDVRKDFCGWSALGPISLYMENVIGIRLADAFTKKITWDIPQNVKGQIGIRNYTFGKITTDLLFENGMLQIVSNGEFTMTVNGEVFAVQTGINQFKIRS